MSKRVELPRSASDTLIPSGLAVERFRDDLARLIDIERDRVLIAVSGGADSVALLLLARAALATYLRECGYEVMETTSQADGRALLDARSDAIDIVICAISGASSADRLTFAQWARATHPAVRVLIAATVEKSARLAAEICEEGPHLRKPYEHQALLDWIKRLRS